MDRYSAKSFIYKGFRDIENPIKSLFYCDVCKDPIREYDVYYEHYEHNVCEKLKCLLEITGTVEKVAERGDV